MALPIDPMTYPGEVPATHHTHNAVASWSAVFAGAIVAAAATLLLTALGAGLGFAEISPWPGRGASATTFAVTTAIWLLVTQWLSSAIGGYLAGRLRAKWHGVHGHEIFFRDTAHGLLTWALATLLVAGVLASAMATLGNAAGRAGGEAMRAGGDAAAMGAREMGGPGPREGRPDGHAYRIDRLFRTDATTSGSAPSGAAAPGGAPMAGDPRQEMTHLAEAVVTGGTVSDEDRAYAARVIAARTGISPADAQMRVDTFIKETQDDVNKARQAADQARIAAKDAAIYLAFAMLMGAFLACVASVIGGHKRDDDVVG